MHDGVITEADTCREFVTPRLVEAGWGAAPCAIGEQRSFTNGRIFVAGGKVRRGKLQSADYLLYCRRDYPLAVVEAKEISLPAVAGVQQTRDYAGKRAAAVDAVTPRWHRATDARNAAIAMGKSLRRLEQDVHAAARGDNAALQAQLRVVKAEQQTHEQAARSAQAECAPLYWPIYNLDLKNPHAKVGLEQADLKDLIASMHGDEAMVMRLLGEIVALVSEVQA